MQGNLSLVMVQDVGVPIVNLRLYSSDEKDKDVDLILEYELPTNFQYQASLSPTFSALRIQEGEYLGFLFVIEANQKAWNDQLKQLSWKLNLTNKQVTDVHNQAKKKLDDEFSKQLSESIQVDKLLRGTDIETQAKELRKLLIVAGMDVETDMSNPEVMDIISNVLSNFNPLV